MHTAQQWQNFGQIIHEWCLSWVIQEQGQRYIESALYSALKSKYGRRESRFTLHSKLYVTLCLLTTSISLRDPLSKITKINSTTMNMFTINLRTSVKFTLFILTSMGRRISLKWRQFRWYCVRRLPSLHTRLLDAELTHWGRMTHICVSKLSSLVQIMACRLVGAKPLSEAMLEYC